MKYSVYKVLKSGREEWRADFSDYRLARLTMSFILSTFDSQKNRYRLKDENGTLLDEFKFPSIPQDIHTKKNPD